MTQGAGDGVSAAKPPTYNLAIAFACVLLGVAAFSGLVVALGLGGEGGGGDPRIAWVFTPVFAGPLVAYLVMRGRLGAAGVLGLLVTLTIAHFTAIFVASAIYKVPVSSDLMDILHILDSAEKQAERAAAWSAKVALARRSALDAGVTAGAIGAGLSFLVLLVFGRAFRRPLALLAMIIVTAILAAIGGFAFTRGLPSRMSAQDFALYLFAPWQTVFGITLAVLFAGHALRRIRN
jgi:hypothetical protein